jgi:hypothetical protein
MVEKKFDAARIYSDLRSNCNGIVNETTFGEPERRRVESARRPPRLKRDAGRAAR